MRLTWEPRMLSILRIVVGLLYLGHGLNKLFDFPPSANHVPYQLFTLVPGLAGLLETIGGTLIVVGLFTRPVAFILSGEMAFAYFMIYAPRSFFRMSAAASRRSCIVSRSSTSSSPAPVSGASIGCGQREHRRGPGADRAVIPGPVELTRGPPG
jgi:uncharacterized membrane protein YphA (DoxX/SURF4 family)